MSERTQATFIFKGTVRKLKSATMATVPVSERTVVVRVDEILKAPDPLSHSAGSEITVLLGDREKVKPGEHAVFYTAGWLFGESVAVRSLGHAAAGGAPRARGAAEEDRSLRAQVEGADMVVTGRVVSVRLPDEPARQGGSSRAAPSPGLTTRISEHSPEWREAVIEVADVEKGGRAPKQIVLWFPSSMDVRWHDAPKFEPGQEGVFLLHKNQAEKSAATARGKRGGAPLYTALHPEDFQPIQKVEQIRRLIKAPAHQEPAATGGVRVKG